MNSKLKRTTQLACVTTAALVLPMLTPATASAAAMAPKMTKEMSFWDAMSSGEAWLNFRPRYEFVSEDNTLRDANAFTLRTILGYKTAKFKGFDALLEFANASRLTTHQNFNSGGGTSPGYPEDYSLVADPSNTVIHRAILNFSGLQDTNLSVGREAIQLDNERFIGAVPWRQTSARFDSIMATNTSLPNTKLTYAYAWGVERIFGVGATDAYKRFAANSHFFNANFAPAAWGTFVPYAYLIDNKNLVSSSVNTFGLRVTGESPEYGNGLSAFYTAEYATQKGANNNPSRVKSHFTNFELGVKNKMLSLIVGQEVLSGNGDVAFMTPYATLHKFNGWADLFLTTPVTGLKDCYVGLTASAYDLTATVKYHDFRADSSSMKYGNEMNYSISANLPHNVNVLVKYADYRKKDTSNVANITMNTKKLWLQTSVSFN